MPLTCFQSRASPLPQHPWLNALGSSKLRSDPISAHRLDVIEQFWNDILSGSPTKSKWPPVASAETNCCSVTTRIEGSDGSPTGTLTRIRSPSQLGYILSRKAEETPGEARERHIYLQDPSPEYLIALIAVSSIDERAELLELVSNYLTFSPELTIKTCLPTKTFFFKFSISFPEVAPAENISFGSNVYRLAFLDSAGSRSHQASPKYLVWNQRAHMMTGRLGSRHFNVYDLETRSPSHRIMSRCPKGQLHDGETVTADPREYFLRVLSARSREARERWEILAEKLQGFMNTQSSKQLVERHLQMRVILNQLQPVIGLICKKMDAFFGGESGTLDSASSYSDIYHAIKLEWQGFKFVRDRLVMVTVYVDTEIDLYSTKLRLTNFSDNRTATGVVVLFLPIIVASSFFSMAPEALPFTPTASSYFTLAFCIVATTVVVGGVSQRAHVAHHWRELHTELEAWTISLEKASDKRSHPLLVAGLKMWRRLLQALYPGSRFRKQIESGVQDEEAGLGIGRGRDSRRVTFLTKLDSNDEGTDDEKYTASEECDRDSPLSQGTTPDDDRVLFDIDPDSWNARSVEDHRLGSLTSQSTGYSWLSSGSGEEELPSLDDVLPREAQQAATDFAANRFERWHNAAVRACPHNGHESHSSFGSSQSFYGNGQSDSSGGGGAPLPSSGGGLGSQGGGLGGSGIPGRTMPVSPGQEANRSFACPFYKKDKIRHYQCVKFELNRIKDVKQHLYRKHGQPIFCPTCSALFETQEAQLAHVRSRTCQAPASGYAVPEGISESQKAQLSKKVSRSAPAENQWYCVWDIAFPGSPRPDSPYRGTAEENFFSCVSEFWEAEGDAIVETIPELSLPGREPYRQTFSRDVVSRILDRLFSGVLNAINTVPAMPTPTGMEPQPQPQVIFGTEAPPTPFPDPFATPPFTRPPSHQPAIPRDPKPGQLDGTDLGEMDLGDWNIGLEDVGSPAAFPSSSFGPPRPGAETGHDGFDASFGFQRGNDFMSSVQTSDWFPGFSRENTMRDPQHFRKF